MVAWSSLYLVKAGVNLASRASCNNTCLTYLTKLTSLMSKLFCVIVFVICKLWPTPSPSYIVNVSVREDWQKTESHLVDFGCLRVVVWVYLLKKENLWQKSFFQVMLNEVLWKIARNYIYNVKADVKQQGIKEVVAVSCYFS